MLRRRIAVCDWLKFARAIVGFLPTSQVSISLLLPLFSVLIQALRSVTKKKKWTQNRPSVTMETSSHVIKVLSVCLRHFHSSNFYFFLQTFALRHSKEEGSYAVIMKRLRSSILEYTCLNQDRVQALVVAGVLSPPIKWCFMRHLIACTLQGRHR